MLCGILDGEGVDPFLQPQQVPRKATPSYWYRLVCFEIVYQVTWALGVWSHQSQSPPWSEGHLMRNGCRSAAGRIRLLSFYCIPQRESGEVRVLFSSIKYLTSTVMELIKNCILYKASVSRLSFLWLACTFSEKAVSIITREWSNKCLGYFCQTSVQVPNEGDIKLKSMWE